jgi:hypothetical protein
VDVKGTAVRFAASASKRRLSAHFIVVEEMMAHNAQMLVLVKLHLVLSILNEIQHHLGPVKSDPKQIPKGRQGSRQTLLPLC